MTPQDRIQTDDDPMERLDRGGLADMLMLAFNPRAAQLLGYLSQHRRDRRNERFALEDRDLRRQEYQRRLDQEQRQQGRMDRDQAIQEAGMQADLATRGARQVPETALIAEAGLDEMMGSVKNPRALVDFPFGTFAIPTYEEQQQRKFKTEDEEARRKYERETEEFQIPEEFGGGATRIKKGEKMRVLIDAFKANHPNLITRETTDDDGNVTTRFYNPQSGKEVFRTTAEGVGKTKSEPVERDIPGSTMKQIEAKAELAAISALQQQFPQGIDNPEYVAKREEYEKDPEIAGNAAIMDALMKGIPRYVKGSFKQHPDYQKVYAQELNRLIDEEKGRRTTKKAATGRGTAAPDKTGYSVGQTIPYGGKKYIYRGLTPAGKMKLEEVQ